MKNKMHVKHLGKVHSAKLVRDKDNLLHLVNLAHTAFSSDKCLREDAVESFRAASECGRLNFEYLIVDRTKGNRVILGATYVTGEHLKEHIALDLGALTVKTPYFPASGPSQAPGYQFI